MSLFDNWKSEGKPLRRSEGKAPNKGARAFRGVDGEGGNDANGVHQYYMLRAGNKLLYTGKPLTALECLEFITSLTNKYIYIGYYFNYDVTMILSPHAGFPIEKIGELCDMKKRNYRRDGTPFPVRWKNFELEFTQSKRFQVGLIDEIDNKVHKRVTIHDCSGFFQGSFLKSLETWKIGTVEERELIAEGKASRADFTGEVDEKEFLYNELECRLLEVLMERLRDASKEAGIQIRNWEGAGQAAAALMTKHKISRYSDELPQEVKDAALCGYFGGRFEVTGIGLYKNVYQYDINSAYPAQIQHLPCLHHGVWIPTTSSEGTSILQVRWKPNRRGRLLHGSPVNPPFPFRSKTGRIYYPLEGLGWYWSPEVREAQKNPAYDIEILQGYEWRQHCDHKPFDMVPDYYAKRKSWGKDGKGIVLKLALNSLYGKTAQSVGKPRFSNPVWAGLITSGTRALLQTVIRQAPMDILMVATDGIFSLSKLDVPVSDRLGDWSEKYYPEMFLAQPGIYFGNEAETADYLVKRTRGISPSLLDRKEFETAWLQDKDSGVVSIDLRVFVGIRSGYAFKHYDQIGQWVEQTRHIAFKPYTKRIPLDGTWQDSISMRLLPWQACSWQEESSPYDRNIPAIAERELGALWDEDQPDFLSY